jgi:hypothetical protein
VDVEIVVAVVVETVVPVDVRVDVSVLVTVVDTVEVDTVVSVVVGSFVAVEVSVVVTVEIKSSHWSALSPILNLPASQKIQILSAEGDPSPVNSCPSGQLARIGIHSKKVPSL